MASRPEVCLCDPRREKAVRPFRRTRQRATESAVDLLQAAWALALRHSLRLPAERPEALKVWVFVSLNVWAFFVRPDRV